MFKIVEDKDNNPDERFCVRCGMTQKDVYRLGYGGYCAVYGKSYGNHSYTTDRELDKWADENGLPE